jgi:hypothetical protein
MSKGKPITLISGDWVENLTALEFDNGVWSIYRYSDDKVAQDIKLSGRFKNDLDNDMIFKDLVSQFMVLKK